MNEIELNNSELDRDRWMNNQREKEKEVKFFLRKKVLFNFEHQQALSFWRCKIIEKILFGPIWELFNIFFSLNFLLSSLLLFIITDYY